MSVPSIVIDPRVGFISVESMWIEVVFPERETFDFWSVKVARVVEPVAMLSPTVDGLPLDWGKALGGAPVNWSPIFLRAPLGDSSEVIVFQMAKRETRWQSDLDSDFDLDRDRFLHFEKHPVAVRRWHDRLRTLLASLAREVGWARAVSSECHVPTVSFSCNQPFRPR